MYCVPSATAPSRRSVRKSATAWRSTRRSSNLPFPSGVRRQPMTKLVRLPIGGRVQGVGYRFWVMREARRRGLTGWVRNRSDGSVEALLKGDDAAVEEVIEACRRGPRLAAVERIYRSDAEDDGSVGFEQLATE